MMNNFSDLNDAEKIFAQHEKCSLYKSELGAKGLFEQVKLNERFYSGDQWHGAAVSKKMPLVRHNLIKRIGEYKQSIIAAENADVTLSGSIINSAKNLLGDEFDSGKLKSLFDESAENARLDNVIDNAVKNAYIAGTGAVYCYWDNDAYTGRFADELRSVPIFGDVRAMCIDIENIDFGEPNEPDVQKQPYIIIAGRMSVENARKIARDDGADPEFIDNIRPDIDLYGAVGDYGGYESVLSEKLTVLTKLYKVKSGDDVRVFGVQVCKNGVLQKARDLGLNSYPLCLFRWNERKKCVYGESEITHIIPNQIAINRMLTAEVWATMTHGMPMMMVNKGVISSDITNSPAQVLNFKGDSEEFANAVKFIVPPDFSANFKDNIAVMIDDTLAFAGAPRAALGSDEMNNASAIESLQRASAAPLRLQIKRYRQFVCDIADSFADYIIRCGVNYAEA